MRYLYITGLLLFAMTAFSQGYSFADLTYPFQVDTLTLNDSTDIAYVDEGSGETTLLFIHGLGSYLSVWEKNIPDLHKTYRCIAIDLPGYGKSAKKGLNISLGYYGDVVADFLQRLEIASAVVVGHSMGGQIAMMLAADKPELVEKLILLAPAGLETFSEKEKQWFSQVVTVESVKQSSETVIRANFAANFHQMPDDAEFLINERLMIREAADFEHYCANVVQSVQAMLSEPVLPILDSIKQPTLILFGSEDKLIPNRFLHPALTTSEVAAIGKDRIANSQVHMVPEAGHFLMFEKSEDVNRRIELFLQ